MTETVAKNDDVEFSFSKIRASKRSGLNNVVVNLKWSTKEGKLLILSSFEIVSNFYPEKGLFNAPPSFYALPVKEQLRELVEAVKVFMEEYHANLQK